MTGLAIRQGPEKDNLMDDHVLDEQLAYYRARAQEYDESILQIGRFASNEARDEGLNVPPDPDDAKK